MRKLEKEKGVCEGKKPFGYFDNEKEIVKRIMQLYRKPRGRKRLGYYQIARKWNEDGVPTRTGVKWNGVTVKQIIERENSY